jgi:hypothetical protein
MTTGPMQFGATNNAGSAAPTQTVLISENSNQATLLVRNDIVGGSLPAGNGLEVVGGPIGVMATGGVDSDSPGIGVRGVADATGVDGSGLRGVRGRSTGDGNGVQGESSSRIASGVYGENLSGGGFGIAGRSNVRSGSFGAAVLGDNTAGGNAGVFNGIVRVNGTLFTAVKGFSIDYPGDEQNRILNHSAVEAPDMMNLYNGNVTTDGDGNATIQLPNYFEALNRDFRYQTTVIGQFAQVFVAQEVMNNRFSIKTDKPNVQVSWQVTGIRQDACANAHRIEVEVEKPEGERGKYLTPEEHGEPANAGIYYVEPQDPDETEVNSGQRQGE